MKKIYKGMNLQMFAAPTGLTVADNIQVRAHEIDFVTRKEHPSFIGYLRNHSSNS